jgi:DNA (cytosine-5)-methyltransferase 1
VGRQIGQLIPETMTARRLTPRECERLQGFEDDWTAQRIQQTGKHAGTAVEQADGPRYKQMGNAVAVPVVEWIVRRIIDVEGQL